MEFFKRKKVIRFLKSQPQKLVEIARINARLTKDLRYYDLKQLQKIVFHIDKIKKQWASNEKKGYARAIYLD